MQIGSTQQRRRAPRSDWGTRRSTGRTEGGGGVERQIIYFSYGSHLSHFTGPLPTVTSALIALLGIGISFIRGALEPPTP